MQDFRFIPKQGSVLVEITMVGICGFLELTGSLAACLITRENRGCGLNTVALLFDKS